MNSTPPTIGIAAGDVFPWQKEHWRMLQSARLRFPHSLLLYGASGIGKADFARALAHSLLCHRPGGDGMACGLCKSCHLLAAASHPDFLELLPDEKSDQIKIEAIRDLRQFAELTSSVSGVRIALLIGANRMNRNAANALLKTLEEPGSQLKLILVSDQISQMLPTVRSRCQKLRLSIPPRDIALGWLQQKLPGEDAGQRLDLLDGRPLAALRADQAFSLHQKLETDFFRAPMNSQTALRLAEQWKSEDLNTLLGVLSRKLAGEIKSRSLGTVAKFVAKSLASLSLREIFGLYDKLLEHRRRTGTALDARLVLEDVLLYWSNLQQAHRA